ncbi:MAG: SGNH/GDSL hydrolase family protein [Phototrophicaceae bacterium]
MRLFIKSLIFITAVLTVSGVVQGQSSVWGADNCIVILGDSLPAGTFVAILPGTGVTVLQGERLAHQLDDALQAENLIHYGIYDLSIGASGIVAPNTEPYLTSRELFIGSRLNCRYVVIFPFLNDLYRSDDTPDGIANYAMGVQALVTEVRDGSPDSQIILMDYYATTLGGAGVMTYGEDVSETHVDAMNAVHLSICIDTIFITCFATGDYLHPIDAFVIGEIYQTEYADIGYTLRNPDDQVLIDGYWRNTPNNPIYGDSLHLNTAGQAIIIDILMQYFFALDPINFAPILD